jgi:hypothetical protein
VKITVYDPEPSEEELELCLRLERTDGGRVILSAVNPGTGERLGMGIILSIGPRGVHLRPSLTPAAGLPLDGRGRVKSYDPWTEEE